MSYLSFLRLLIILFTVLSLTVISHCSSSSASTDGSNKKGLVEISEEDKANFASSEAYKVAVVIGINYSNNHELTNLQYAVPDAKAFAETLRSQQGYDVKLLTDDLPADHKLYPNVPNILRTVDKVISTLGANDTFVFYFSGHGGAIDKGSEKQNILCPVDFVPNRPERSSINLHQDIIAPIEQKANVKRKIFFIDACRENFSPNSRSINAPSFAMEDPYFKNAKGYPILLSTEFGKLSYEVPELGHGLYTFYVLEALSSTEADYDQNGFISLIEVSRYIYNKMRQFSLTNDDFPGAQLPTLTGEFNGDFLLAEVAKVDTNTNVETLDENYSYDNYYGNDDFYDYSKIEDYTVQKDQTVSKTHFFKVEGNNWVIANYDGKDLFETDLTSYASKGWTNVGTFINNGDIIYALYTTAFPWFSTEKSKLSSFQIDKNFNKFIKSGIRKGYVPTSIFVGSDTELFFTEYQFNKDYALNYWDIVEYPNIDIYSEKGLESINDNLYNDIYDNKFTPLDLIYENESMYVLYAEGNFNDDIRSFWLNWVAFDKDQIIKDLIEKDKDDFHPISWTLIDEYIFIMYLQIQPTIQNERKGSKTNSDYGQQKKDQVYQDHGKKAN